MSVQSTAAAAATAAAPARPAGPSWRPAPGMALLVLHCGLPGGRRGIIYLVAPFTEGWPGMGAHRGRAADGDRHGLLHHPGHPVARSARFDRHGSRLSK